MVVFAPGDIWKGSVFTRQLDPLCHSVLSLKFFIHTYRGNVKGTCLEKREELVTEYFEEMHTNGCIHEEIYNRSGI